MYGDSFGYALGNLVRKPEVRYTPSGKAVAKFTIAVNKTRHNKKTGEKIEVPTFIDIVAWEKLADVVKPWNQGDPVMARGEIIQENWEENGKKRSKLVINASAVRNVGRRPVDAGATPEQPAAPKPVAKPVAKPAPKPVEQQEPAQEEDFSVNPDEEIPF